MSGLMLRPARPLDAGAVAGILSGFIDETDWMPRIHTRAEEIAFADTLIARGWTTVAVEDGVVSGFLSRNGEEVHALYLATAARGRGIGARLLDEAKAASARLALWCFEANTAAQGFYRAQGFDEAGRTDGARNDENLPDIRYVWERA
ncbi:GNAT family N-acetyltransferase [Pseudooceanicola sp. LIPI14-2-Ac024]|uniref:GNAT family N-acetyltransferase n=1 Tax=Pseudooceanicola sp. LIPI14-2-Ac024 TaxID=3344875 RepID=UPI0035CF63A4